MIEHCKRIDFVFNLYLVSNIKSLERQRRAVDESTRIVITHIDQELPNAHQSSKQPSDFERFWTLTEDRITLQRLLITWITEFYKGNAPVYLGGCNIDEKNSCLKIVNGICSTVQGLFTMKQMIV